MKKKLISALVSVAMVATLLAGCGSTGTTDTASQAPETQQASSAEAAGNDTAANDTGSVSTEGVHITMLNTKSEIQTQFEELSEIYKEKTGVEIEVYAANGDSPSEEIAKKYAAGDAPTLIMGDAQDIMDIAAEKGVDLSNEEWAANGGKEYGMSIDGKLYSFPFCIEARGLIYNKTAIDEMTGESFDPANIKTIDDLKTLLDKLVAGGMETPIALNKEDWSLGGHLLTQVYEEQDGTLEGATAFIDDLKAGTADLANNDRFNSIMDTLDLLKQYNMNKEDPMAADYDVNAASIAEGDVAFWFNGNWAWAEISEYIEDGTEIGLMPYVQTDNSNNANDWLAGSASKHVMIDQENSTPEQQQAAKDFLNWLVSSEEGKDFMINQCSLVPAISTIQEEATNPLGKDVQTYTEAGKLVPGYPQYPGDHWKECGAIMQKYVADQIDRAGLAEELTTYWKGVGAK